MDDLPELLATFAARATGDRQTVRRTLDAVQALSRLQWPGNLIALEAMVRRLVSRGRGGHIRASDLPPDLLAFASRRPLARLELQRSGPSCRRCGTPDLCSARGL